MAFPVLEQRETKSGWETEVMMVCGTSKNPALLVKK